MNGRLTIDFVGLCAFVRRTNGGLTALLADSAVDPSIPAHVPKLVVDLAAVKRTSVAHFSTILAVPGGARYAVRDLTGQTLSIDFRTGSAAPPAAVRLVDRGAAAARPRLPRQGGVQDADDTYWIPDMEALFRNGKVQPGALLAPETPHRAVKGRVELGAGDFSTWSFVEWQGTYWQLEYVDATGKKGSQAVADVARYVSPLVGPDVDLVVTRGGNETRIELAPTGDLTAIAIVNLPEAANPDEVPKIDFSVYRALMAKAFTFPEPTFRLDGIGLPGHACIGSHDCPGVMLNE